MKDSYILYQQHVMWYESGMITECLDSLANAIKHAKNRVRLKFCLNAQTYIEKPKEGIEPLKLLETVAQHPVLKHAEITYKTDGDLFYNIGDWRREVYDHGARYTVWGESDCLLPMDFFYVLESFNADTVPHILSFSSRKMWDDTWISTEHVDLRKYSHKKNTVSRFLPKKMFVSDHITQQELDDYNSIYEKIDIEKVSVIKVDGALLCMSGGFDEEFIAPDMHFVREDTCLENFCQIRRIPQYVVATRIKGHNYFHPNKRQYTDSSRSEDKYKVAEKESIAAMEKFIRKLANTPKKLPIFKKV